MAQNQSVEHQAYSAEDEVSRHIETCAHLAVGSQKRRV